MTETYTCGRCGRTYEKLANWTEEDVLNEALENGFDPATEQMAVICEACYIEVQQLRESGYHEFYESWSIVYIEPGGQVAVMGDTDGRHMHWHSIEKAQATLQWLRDLHPGTYDEFEVMSYDAIAHQIMVWEARN